MGVIAKCPLRGCERLGCNLNKCLVNGLKKRKRINEYGNHAKSIQKLEALFKKNTKYKIK